MRVRARRRIEFGDFQTPIALARAICSLVARSGFSPASILEPTCGTGAFLTAALETFPAVSRVLGFEINAEYVAQARRAVAGFSPRARIEIQQSDVFLINWPEVVKELPEPILIIGNPPWVTHATLGALESANLPARANLDGLRGIDALTGKSNFDVSEWIIRNGVALMNAREALLAMICKTSVARKVLLYAWQNGLRVESASLYLLDAQEHFAASVDACLLVIKTAPRGESKTCRAFASLHAHHPVSSFGLRDNLLVADLELYEKHRGLLGNGARVWRSGVKHDCAGIFELHPEDGQWVNGLGERIVLEDNVIYLLLKSADLAAERAPRRWMLVPQRSMNDDPSHLRWEAPRAWDYLVGHAHLLAKRKSAVYKHRPPFSLFGVGAYTFAPWKVAISGLYKKLAFVLVRPFQGRPVVLDDTCYFFPCMHEEEAQFLYALVTSDLAQAFWSAFIFWDAKRPITAQLLNSLDLVALSRALGKDERIARAIVARRWAASSEGAQQRMPLEELD